MVIEDAKEAELASRVATDLQLYRQREAEVNLMLVPGSLSYARKNELAVLLLPLKTSEFYKINHIVPFRRTRKKPNADFNENSTLYL